MLGDYSPVEAVHPRIYEQHKLYLMCGFFLFCFVFLFFKYIVDWVMKGLNLGGVRVNCMDMIKILTCNPQITSQEESRHFPRLFIRRAVAAGAHVSK